MVYTIARQSESYHKTLVSANFFMQFSYPPSLPISSCLEQLKELISAHQIVIVAGETGSGKTTQLPKLCLELFHQSKGWIGCTQPRRIAATSVADRVAEELGADRPLVGSKIRFRDQTTPSTRIKFMTDGVLLAEIRNDPLLKRYRVIIVDEAHERNLNIDFLLGYLHTLTEKRKDLKIIITSATIDTQAFSEHFRQAPVATIEGRTHPVEIIYSPLPDDENEISYLEHCIDVTADICAHRPPGDVLLFLPTEKDIRSCCEILRGRVPTHRILPLFGRLQSRDQKLDLQGPQATQNRRCHQCCRDLGNGSGYPLCGRFRAGQDRHLPSPVADDEAAHRQNFTGQLQPARWKKWTNRTWYLRTTLQRR